MSSKRITTFKKLSISVFRWEGELRVQLAEALYLRPIVPEKTHQLSHHQVFNPTFTDSFLMAIPAVLFDAGAFIVVVDTVSAGPAFSAQHRAAIAADELGGQQIFLLCLVSGRGFFVALQPFLHPVKQVLRHYGRYAVRQNGFPKAVLRTRLKVECTGQSFLSAIPLVSSEYGSSCSHTFPMIQVIRSRSSWLKPSRSSSRITSYRRS